MCGPVHVGECPYTLLYARLRERLVLLNQLLVVVQLGRAQMPEREPLQRVHRAAKNQTTARRGPCPCPTRAPRPMRKQRVRSFVCGAVTWLMLYNNLAASLVSQVLCNMAGLPCAGHEGVVTIDGDNPAVDSKIPSPTALTEEATLSASSLQEGAPEALGQQTTPVATLGTCHLDGFGHARLPGTRRPLLSSVVACAREQLAR